MHHVCAFTQLQGPVTNGKVNALTDGILTIQNNDFLPPNDMQLMALAAMSPTLSAARITSPKLRQITQPQIRPVTLAAVLPTNPNVQKFTNLNVTLKGLEEFQAQVTISPGTTEQSTIIAFLLDRYVPPVAGDIITLRGSSTTTATANSWTQLTYTLDDQLPSGLYALVGGEHQSANGQAFRFIIDNQFFRPGGLSVTALGNRTIDEQYMGRWGEWGRFKNTSLPRLEVLCNGADASHTIFPQVVKVG